MVRPLLGIVLCVILALASGVVWLSVSDVKPASQTMHQVLPDAGFPH